MAMWNIFVFTIKSKMSLMVTSMHLPCGRSLKCVQDSTYHVKIFIPLFLFFLLCHCFSFLLFSQCQLLFLAPFLPITYCNSLEKRGPCGTVFEKEANKEKVKTNGNKLTCPVPPLPPTLVLQMPVRHRSPQSRIFTRWGKVISVAPCAI